MSNHHVILPFNALETERAAMFVRKPPEVLWMPVVLYHFPAASVTTDKSAAAKLQVYLHKAHHLTRIEQHIRVPMVYVMEMPHCIRINLQPKQRDWMHREAYLQCGYYDQPGVRGIVPCIAVAMTLYDSGVCLEEIEDPAKQPPIPSTPEDAAEFESAVRNHYRSGVAVLSNHLLEHRTRVLVECQAILLGRDPQVEYDRFLKAGGWYYLQYPELCP